MKPRKKLEGDKWKNPNFDKGVVAPVERFWHMCEQKGLVADKEVEDWLYEVINYAYRVGYINHSNAIFESFQKNIGAVYNAINKDSESELKKMHEHFNKNIE